MTPHPHFTKKHILDAAFPLIENNGWKNFSMAQLASALDCSEELLRDSLPSKEGFFHLWTGFLVESIEKELPQHELLQLPPKDRLLELYLLRFDLMTPYKKALKPFFTEVLWNPRSACVAQKNLADGWKQLLTYAAIPTSSLISQLQMKALVGLYLYTLFHWLNNELDPEQLQAILDRYLLWGEKVVQPYQ